MFNDYQTWQLEEYCKNTNSFKNKSTGFKIWWRDKTKENFLKIPKLVI